MNLFTLSSRDLIGDTHYMKQLEDIPVFPVEVFQEDEHGFRTLLRVESAGS